MIIIFIIVIIVKNKLQIMTSIYIFQPNTKSLTSFELYYVFAKSEEQVYDLIVNTLFQRDDEDFSEEEFEIFKEFIKSDECLLKHYEDIEEEDYEEEPNCFLLPLIDSIGQKHISVEHEPLEFVFLNYPKSYDEYSLREIHQKFIRTYRDVYNSRASFGTGHPKLLKM